MQEALLYYSSEMLPQACFSNEPELQYLASMIMSERDMIDNVKQFDVH